MGARGRAQGLERESREKPPCLRARSHAIARAAAGEGGLAIVGVVVVMVLLAGATATTLWLTGTELWAAGRARAGAQARYTAEAGLHHAIALLAPGASFASLVAGSGGLADPARSGPLPAAGGWADFPGPPFGVAVFPTALPPGPGGAPGGSGRERVLLEAHATAVRGARHRMRATVGRARDPYAPAALVVASGSIEIEGSAVSSAGGEAVPPVVVDAGAPAGGPQAAIAAPSAAAVDAALRALGTAGAELRGVPSDPTLRPLDLEAFARESGLASMAPGDLAGPQGSAGTPAALWLRPGIADGLAGEGAILASGDLELRGSIDFRGALLVAGTLRIDAGACSLAGMVWAHALELASGCIVRFDAGALAVADRALPLPRLPVLLALGDV